MPYPRELEGGGRTRDGAQYRIRPIRADDLGRERAFLQGLSDASRRARMLGTFRDPPEALLERFVNVDYHDGMALLATRGCGADEQIIGIARYAAAHGGSECELAVTVADAWQARGIGSRLGERLIEYARAQGFRRMTGTVLAQNAPMIALARHLGMQLDRSPEDPSLLKISLGLGAAGRAPRGRAARAP
jgi:acetyltransferase